MTAPPALVWIRNDLRLADNPALVAATKAADTVIALYVHETDAGLRPPGGAARWWLHHSLVDFAANLAEHGIELRIASGQAQDIVLKTVREASVASVFWNRRYGPEERRIDAAIKQSLQTDGVTVESFAAHVLLEPWTIETGQGKPYSVFTPFWKTLKTRDIAVPLRRPAGRKAVRAQDTDSDYRQPEWAGKLGEHWKIGEAAARDVLADFLDDGLDGYAEGRDIPGQSATSRLSPHLRFGEISPRQVWHAASALAQRDHHKAEMVDAFLRELAWRDFNYHQLYHRDDITTVSMQAKYDGMDWRRSKADLLAWQRGQTGIPMVDAGMRELWQTGFMQNRVRMLTASLLTKNLLIDWRLGEQWFWDCLVDADIANNPGNWQWVAGSGLDASPFFRIFNPVTQGDRFDADGAYVRRWVPELAALPDEWLQKPSEAPEELLRRCEITLDKTYPSPMIDLKTSRQRALDAAKAL